MSRLRNLLRAKSHAAPVPAADDGPLTVDRIPGWFTWTDQRVFEHFLSPNAVAPKGDLVELGVYLGKSAALIGMYKQPDEIFTVCDLFGADPGEDRNAHENLLSYRSLDRESFERNYLGMHDELPIVLQRLSSTILDHVKPHTARFVHVDASHLYEHVAIDVQSARELLMPGGVVVFDDYRSVHTPGVSAAVWEAVFNFGLKPICVTPIKMYASFEDPAPHQMKLDAWLTEFDRLRWETQVINGAEVRRISPPAKPRK